MLAAGDLPRNGGRVYHLNVSVELFSPNILIVGDPDRVAAIAAEHLTNIEGEEFHRGLRTVTGTVRETDQRVMVTTSGMGTPSLEIVLNELIALNEYDIASGRRKDQAAIINIIRLGTSGALQEDTPLGAPIVSEIAVGLDNTGLFYEVQADGELEELEHRVAQAIGAQMRTSSRFFGAIRPYAARANPEIAAALRAAALCGVSGITVSNSGFFANQGRVLGDVRPAVTGIDELFSGLPSGICGLRFENMEMECSFLFHFMGALCHRAGALCVAIANRRRNTFTAEYRRHIHEATAIAFQALARF